MLIISLSDLNQEFWPHFRCSQRKVTIFSLSVFGALEEIIVKMAFTSIFRLNFCQSPRSSPLIWLLSSTEASNQTYLILRRPNTVFAHTFADAIQRTHKDCKNKHVVNRVIIFSIQNPHYLRYFSIYKELRKSPMSNFIETVLTEGI